MALRPAPRRGPSAWWSRPGAFAAHPIGLDLVRAAFAGRGVGTDAGSPGVRAGAEPPRATDPGEGDVDLPWQDPRPAAVLCALFEEEGLARVVLTRRSGSLRSHAGEVSLPGGRLDPGERALDAALREAREEVGLEPDLVEVLGELRPLSTRSSREAIRPFVGALGRRPELRANADEVDRVFTVALSDLVLPGVHHVEVRGPDAGGHPGISTRSDPARTVHFFEISGETIWGATARILADLLDLVLAPAR
ncbi:MAG: CoA pyrophosphatase [Actinomycetota bacterium]|nr:CoA pyrophosphatase [Actinomycetota bacterium]